MIFKKVVNDLIRICLLKVVASHILIEVQLGYLLNSEMLAIIGKNMYFSLLLYSYFLNITIRDFNTLISLFIKFGMRFCTLKEINSSDTEKPLTRVQNGSLTAIQRAFFFFCSSDLKAKKIVIGGSKFT